MMLPSEVHEALGDLPFNSKVKALDEQGNTYNIVVTELEQVGNRRPILWLKLELDGD